MRFVIGIIQSRRDLDAAFCSFPNLSTQRRTRQVRMNPSSSLAAQSNVFSIASPCATRTIIFVMIAWV